MEDVVNPATRTGTEPLSPGMLRAELGRLPQWRHFLQKPDMPDRYVLASDVSLPAVTSTKPDASWAYQNAVSAIPPIPPRHP